ncbi:MAG: Gfo/Idh/MocA family oxidoreductase [Planctomycetota bacterium]|nr:Gfo/Idh/MocA family oxidoreductase [Planctomycetota bacterium]MDA1211127.1 Gfo/Idh/MocA family oxidoreductase [Planctomycetota bacterium]
MAKSFRAAVIGATKQGDYGHGLDTAFLDNPRITLVAIADADSQGRDRVAVKLDVLHTYADYREMFAQEQLDLVAIGPRWVTGRVDMICTAAEAGCHIYCEKPFTDRLEEADTIVAACHRAGVKLQMAHQFRAMPPVVKALSDLQEGKYGKLLRMHARPKDDHRGGGEELIVHGTHLFDLMIAAAGRPKWVSARITMNERDVTKSDARTGAEPVGPIAGDACSVQFGFDKGVTGFFESIANQHRDDRPSYYGLLLECENALLHIRRLGDVFVYPAPQVLPEEENRSWEKVWIPEWHFTPEHKPQDLSNWIDRGNHILVTDLLNAIEQDRDPLSSLDHALLISEMIQGAYASHFSAGARQSIPLTERKHPLDAG